MLFQQASGSTSSEDDNYGWRTHLVRRREPSSRRRKRQVGYFAMKSRKKKDDSSCGVRFFIGLIFLSLLAYEATVIYFPLSAKASLHRQSVREQASGETNVTKVNAPTSPPPQAVSGADVASVVRVTKDSMPEPGTLNSEAGSVEQDKSSRTVASRAMEIERAADMRDKASSSFQGQRPQNIDSDDVFSGRKYSINIPAMPRHQRRSRSNSDYPEEPLKQVTAASLEKVSKPGANENFWDWFQEAKREEGNSKIQCPEEHQRLCQMFYKFVRKYNIRSVFDASCTKNIPWVTVVLKKISSEIWGFQYHCCETDEATMESTKNALRDFNFISFTTERWWRVGFPQDVDLVFAWDVLAHTAYGRVWTFFVNVRKQEIKYVLVDNYPGILNDPSPDRFYLNLRKHPFRFPAAKEVVQNVTEPGETANRQLLFYEGVSLPDNLG